MKIYLYLSPPLTKPQKGRLECPTQAPVHDYNIFLCRYTIFGMNTVIPLIADSWH